MSGGRPNPIVDGQRRCTKCGEMFEVDVSLAPATIRSSGNRCLKCRRAYFTAYYSQPDAKARAKKFSELPEQRASRLAYGRDPDVKRETYERYVFKEFGITVEDVARAFNRQGGECVGCIQKLNLDFSAPHRSRVYIDHDHATGEFRGLLCISCNHAIGRVKDDPMIMDRLATYLRRSRRLHCLA